jgi:SAM-dependent methyltransferase
MGFGFQVTGSDISLAAVQRAGKEAGCRGLRLGCLVADVRALAVRSATFDVVLSCDNSLPHLLSENDIRSAFKECFRCIRPRGGCVISMRDYGVPPSPGTVETQDYGDRTWSSRRCRLLQTRRWRGQLCDVAFELVTNDEAKEVVLRTPEATYFAIEVERMAVLMGEAGFTRVRRIDGCLFQPVLVGSR